MSPNTLNTVEIAITSIELAILRGSTANHPWQSTERGTCCGRVNADRSTRPMRWSRGTIEPSEPLVDHDWNSARGLRHSSTRTPASPSDLTAAATANVACWRQQVWHASNSQQTVFFLNEARQCGQAAHDRSEVTAQTQADILHEWFTIETVADNTVSNQQMEILNQMNSVAESHTTAETCLGV